MKKRSRFISTLWIAAMLCAVCSGALAASDETVFDRAFCESVSPLPGKIFYPSCLVYSQEADSFYGMLEDSIYVWSAGGGQPRRYCDLPAKPDWKESWWEKKYRDLPEEERQALGRTVDALAVGEGAVWGLNLYSGKLGRITEQGVVWQETAMDTSPFFDEGSVAMHLAYVSGWLEDGALYVFASDEGRKQAGDDPMVLLRFDVSTGDCTELNTQAASNCCPYQPGSFLLFRRADERSMQVSVLEGATGRIEDLPLRVPFPDGRADASRASDCVGGAAYDPKSDSIYFIMEKKVWRSAHGEPFAPVAQVPVEFTWNTMCGWVVADGRYGAFALELYLRDVSR